jgi:hypothetical protein
MRLDLNAEKYHGIDGLHSILESHVSRWEGRSGVAQDTSLPRRFLGVIERSYLQTGRRVVVLVDEYDKPLLSVLDNPALLKDFKDTLKAFYGVLKSSDAWLKFAFITGVTKFGQVSVFSDLYQPTDLSLHPMYATLCGITEEELLANFAPELETLAIKQKMNPTECLAKERSMYNGNKFHQALAQMDAKGYSVPYEADGRAVVKVGVEFDKATRNIGRWLLG